MTNEQINKCFNNINGGFSHNVDNDKIFLMKKPDTPVPEEKLDLNIGKRVKLVIKENKLSYGKLATLLEVSKTAVYALADNEDNTSINYKLIVGICYKLGYSPWWLLTGLGTKRGEKSTKIITDIQQFRVELDARDAVIKIMRSQIDLLFKMVENLTQK